MRVIIKEFVRTVSDQLDLPEPIYEFGAYQAKEQGAWADLRGYFPGKEYFGADFRCGPGVDILLDLHSIELPDNHVGTVICMDTFEHVRQPFKAISEIHRILRPEGVLLISSVMNFPIHQYPADYWRFTPQGFEVLLQQFPEHQIFSKGENHHPHTVAALAFKSASTAPSELRPALQRWSRRPHLSLKRIIIYLLPPVFLKPIRAIYSFTKLKLIRWFSLVE